jgi:hypothetical protein
MGGVASADVVNFSRPAEARTERRHERGPRGSEGQAQQRPGTPRFLRGLVEPRGDPCGSRYDETLRTFSMHSLCCKQYNALAALATDWQQQVVSSGAMWE